MRSRTLIIIAVAIAVLVIVPYAIYRSSDMETLELDDAARESAPGQFVQLSQGYTHYELGGPADGRVVVLLAGFSVPYYIWDPTYTALVDAGFRVLRYDYYGRGYSDRPDTAYNVDLHITQLNELLDKLQITGPMDLVGLSFGGGVITTYAYRYPDRVRSLVYVDPGFRAPYPPPSFSGMRPVWSFLAAIIEQPYWAQSQMGDFLEPKRFPDWAARYRVQMQYKGFRRARFSELVTNADQTQGDEITKIAEHPRPVLVIWGKQDETVPFENSVWLMQQMPKARLIAVDEAGHLPHMEQPEVVNPEIVAFLSQ
jgi:pimeloyl-ACP methyl ester carboxylesterase